MYQWHSAQHWAATKPPQVDERGRTRPQAHHLLHCTHLTHLSYLTSAGACKTHRAGQAHPVQSHGFWTCLHRTPCGQPLATRRLYGLMLPRPHVDQSHVPSMPRRMHVGLLALEDENGSSHVVAFDVTSENPNNHVYKVRGCQCGEAVAAQ